MPRATLKWEHSSLYKPVDSHYDIWLSINGKSFYLYGKSLSNSAGFAGEILKEQYVKVEIQPMGIESEAARVELPVAVVPEPDIRFLVVGAITLFITERWRRRDGKD